MDEDVFLRALAAAQAAYPEGAWERLLPGKRASAIYQEMRRIDPASVQGLLFTSTGDRGHG